MSKENEESILEDPEEEEDIIEKLRRESTRSQPKQKFIFNDLQQFMAIKIEKGV